MCLWKGDWICGYNVSDGTGLIYLKCFLRRGVCRGGRSFLHRAIDQPPKIHNRTLYLRPDDIVGLAAFQDLLPTLERPELISFSYIPSAPRRPCELGTGTGTRLIHSSFTLIRIKV